MNEENSEQDYIMCECDSCGEEKEVKLRDDPFIWEVYNKKVERWLCDECFETRRNDV